MRSVAWTIVLITVLSVAFVASSCSGDGDESNGAGAAGPTSTGPTGGTGGTGGLFNNGGGINAGLEIEPPTATIIVDNGISTPLQLTAKKNGLEVFPGAWDVDFGSVATVDNTGLVTATNAKGGQVRVTASHEGATGTAVIDVVWRKTINNAGVSVADQDKLRNATVWDQGIAWAYPYDETVWPTGLLPPEMMWNGGATTDIYFFKFASQYLDVEVFTDAPPPSRYPVDNFDWIAINESGRGESVAVTGNRLAAGAPDASKMIEHSWQMASGSLRGTVYYWANNLGRIVRIKPGDPQPEDFLQTAGVTGCTACHVVSADGHTMVIGGDVSTSTYDLLTDTTTLGLGSVGKPVRNWAMPALSPNGQFLVENNAPLPGPPGGADGMWNAQTGQKLTGSGLDGVLLDMPAFGPDANKLAYTGHAAPYDLFVYDFDQGLGQVSNNLFLVPAGNDPNLNAIAFPSVSPSVKKGEGEPQTWISYHRGQYPGSLDTRFGPGDLYLASADVPGVEVRLAKLNGDAYPFAAGQRDLHYNYEPTFAPKNAGGYFWVVFTSRRTYGNRLTGASTVVKQLWVAAIDQFPEPGQDPSHPAFWVPGQDMSSLNMRGFWALDPCIQQGEMCTNDGDCCDARKCENGLCGGPKECAEIGEVCNGDGDCCDPNAFCIGGECQYPPPQ